MSVIEPDQNAANILALIIHHAATSTDGSTGSSGLGSGAGSPLDSSGGQASQLGAQALSSATQPATLAPTVGAAPSTGTTTAPNAGGTNDAIGIPKDTTISGAFGESRGGSPHPGVDLAIPVGTPLVAAMPGKITVAGNNDPNGYGNYVEITTANGMQIRYGHLSAISVAVGDTVKAGQLIGKSGGEKGAPGSGNSEGPHVHFEVDVNGKPVDPSAVLAGGGQIIKGTGSSNPAVQAMTATAKAPDPAAVATNILDLAAGKPAKDLSATSPAGTPSASAGGSTVSGATKGADADPAAVDAFLNATKQHESGGDYTIYNESGQSNASGAYQFLGSTWRAMGGSTQNAAEATPAEQDAVARKMALDLFNKYHSWRLVAIAWYGGPGIADQVAAGNDPGSPEGQGGYLAYGDTISRMMSGG